ncbi:hypothetical protein O6H91_22G063600 [Diphasiastrum complanatum]|uniref:Uncharacterized protein n=1 Tax=Diphasiastrum complanatum TaxID=34168 RepID=A0ACC2AG62_DIPCM|nr:hypothetical protein O6H91_22G063600 [Diphasiastrum complanatum]
MDDKKRKLEENGATVIEISKEDVKKLLDILTPEQVNEILQDAAVQHEEVLEEIRKHADKDPVHRKIFVRGLGWDTTTDTLKSVFSQYGELEDGIVIKDKATGKSRGFGFITFKHMDGSLRALKEPSKKIENRTTVCQLASTGPNSSSAQPAEDVSSRKLYVGNLPLDLTVDQFIGFFSQFGEIAESPQGFDNTTGRSRGFGLLVYKSSEYAKRALHEPVKYINGHQIYCKLSAEGSNQKPGAPIGQLGLQEGGEMAKMGQLVDPNTQLGHPGGLNVPFGQVNKGMMTTGIPLNQAIHGAMSQGIQPAMHAALTSTNQSLGVAAMNNPQNLNAMNYPAHSNLNTPATLSHSQGHPQQITSQGMQSQASLRAGLSGYGNQTPIGMYGAQGVPYSGQPAGLSAVEGPNYYGTAASTVPLQAGPSGIQAGAGGPYMTAGYPSAQQQFGGAVASRGQTPGAPSNLAQYYHG